MAIFFLGVLGIITSTLFFPVLRAVRDSSPATQTAIALNRTLHELKTDLSNANAAGINLASESNGWSLMLIGHDWPSEAAGTWSKSIKIYQYQADKKKIRVATTDNPRQPDGSTILNGSEPSPLDVPKLLLSSIQWTEVKTIPYIESQSWQTVKDPLILTIRPPQGSSIRVYRDFKPVLASVN